MAVGCAEMEWDKNPREKVRREAQSARATIETRKEEAPAAVECKHGTVARGWRQGGHA